MKETLLSRLCILFLGVYYTLRTSVLAVWAAKRGVMTRKKGNELMQEWTSQVFAIANATFHIEYKVPIIFETGKSYILMSNHQSYFDIPLIYKTIPEGSTLRMIGKKEIFQVPLWGQGMKAAEFISIDRSNHEKSMASLEIAKEKMNSGVMIYIAPEGTRSRNGKLKKFKKGGFLLAIQTDSIIIPIGLRGTERMMPPDSTDFIRGQKIKSYVGTPIDASKYGINKRDELMNDVRSQILELSEKVE